MIRRTIALVRRALSGHTTVAAYLALLLASSTAAYAAATIGSPQVINNSLQSVDLKDGAAVGGVDVINDSLTGADIDEASLNGVGRKLQYSAAATGTTTKTSLLTVAGYTFKASCEYSGSGTSLVLVRLFVRGPAGDYQSHKLRSSNDNTQSEANQVYSSTGSAFASNTDVEVWIGGASGFGFQRSVGTVWVHSGSTLLQVDVHAFADWRQSGATGACTLYGMVTRGSSHGLYRVGGR